MVRLFSVRNAVWVVVLFLPVLAMVGCASVAPPEVSGGTKVLMGRMTSLTSTEVQAMASVANITLTDAQAQAIVQFLVDNNINSLNDAEALITKWQTDPLSVKLPDGFLQLFLNWQPAPGATQSS